MLNTCSIGEWAWIKCLGAMLGVVLWTKFMWKPKCWALLVLYPHCLHLSAFIKPSTIETVNRLLTTRNNSNQWQILCVPWRLIALIPSYASSKLDGRMANILPLKPMLRKDCQEDLVFPIAIWQHSAKYLKEWFDSVIISSNFIYRVYQYSICLITAKLENLGFMLILCCFGVKQYISRILNQEEPPRSGRKIAYNFSKFGRKWRGQNREISRALPKNCQHIQCLMVLMNFDHLKAVYLSIQEGYPEFFFDIHKNSQNWHSLYL